MTRPILYSFRRCPYAMRARMALLVAEQPCILREIVLRAKPAEMIAASPKATVPVLVLADGAVIDQSLDIMRWALARNDPHGWLRGDDGLIAVNDGAFKHHLDGYKYADRHGSDPLCARDAALALLAGLEGRLATHDALCGAHDTIADIAIFPFVRQFAAVDPAWFAAQPVARVRAWLDRHVASVLFARAMTRRPPWRAGDPVTPL